MAAEQFANNAQSTLASAITAGATSLTVASAAAFPSQPQFRILIDSEILLVTAVSGTTFTVTRAAEAVGGVQQAAAHAQGTYVTHVITAGALANLARTDAANSYTVSPQTVTADADGHRGLVVKAHSGSQSANLQEWQSGGGTALGVVSPAGYFGAGTSAPQRGVHLSGDAGTSAATAVLMTDTGAPSGQQNMVFNSFGSTPRGSFAVNRLNDDFSFGHAQFLLRSDNDYLGVGPNAAAGPSYPLHVWFVDGATTTVTTHVGITHTSSGSPGDGFGTALLWQVGTGVAPRDCAEVQALWATHTDASRKGRIALGAHDYNTAANAPREGVRVEADGSQALLGFYGVAAVARAVLATGAGHTVDDVITALQNLGLVKQS